MKLIDEIIETKYIKPISLELLNSKYQTFVKWAKQAQTKEELYSALTYMFKNMMPVILRLPVQKNILNVLFYFDFPFEVLYVSKTGIIFKIDFIQHQSEISEITLSDSENVLLAPAGFCDLYGIVESCSLIKINENALIIKTNAYSTTSYPDHLNYSEIADIILRDKKGVGLRSNFPLDYVWYHDLLFIVTERATMGASKKIKDDMYVVIEIMRNNGIEPILRLAYYPTYLQRSISAECTWYCLENTRQIRNRVTQMDNAYFPN